MSTSIHEAILYGDLVRHLRSLWSEQAAQFNETSLAEEQTRIDDLIRTWFFAPQADLGGLTPRQIIRNEEHDQPSTVPHNHSDGAVHVDCPVCQARQAGELTDGELRIELAPDLTLLDEHDPEGYDALEESEADEDDDVAFDPDEETSDAPPKEARTWLTQNANNRCFAGNRFYDRQEALDFVNRLYELGALIVLVDNIFDEPYRLREQGGAYADTLQVYLPPSLEERAAIRAVFEHELLERQGLELDQYSFGDILLFWWD